MLCWQCILNFIDCNKFFIWERERERKMRSSFFLSWWWKCQFKVLTNASSSNDNQRQRGVKMVTRKKGDAKGKKVHKCFNVFCCFLVSWGHPIRSNTGEQMNRGETLRDKIGECWNENLTFLPGKWHSLLFSLSSSSVYFSFFLLLFIFFVFFNFLFFLFLFSLSHFFLYWVLVLNSSTNIKTFHTWPRHIRTGEKWCDVNEKWMLTRWNTIVDVKIYTFTFMFILFSLPPSFPSSSSFSSSSFPLLFWMILFAF